MEQMLQNTEKYWNIWEHQHKCVNMAQKQFTWLLFLDYTKLKVAKVSPGFLEMNSEGLWKCSSKFLDYRSRLN